MEAHLAHLWLSGTTEVLGSGLATSRTRHGAPRATVLIESVRPNAPAEEGA